MQQNAVSIRPFIGAKDFAISRIFYNDLGFEEIILEHNLSYFKNNSIGFYLQDAYVKDWIDNSMIFLEVESAEAYYQKLLELDFPKKYAGVRLEPVRTLTWGKECFLHDPSGILWHFGEFNKS